MNRRALQSELPRRIVSGGQTGVDRAALDWAIDLGLDHGGWCPAGRRAEDGPIPARYRLDETESRSYRVRTRRNVQDSDATLILNRGPLEGGTALTLSIAQRATKPCLVIALDRADGQQAAAIIRWLREVRPAVLNVAGPREGRQAGIYGVARALLNAVAGGAATPPASASG